MQKLIINFTPTGMIPTKEMTPHVPICPNEIIEQVHEVNELGITMVHLHARTDKGQPSHNISTYQKIMEGIRARCPNLIICLSLSGRTIKDFEKRSAAIELKPDMGSLTLGSLNSQKISIMNSPEIITKLALKMQDYGVAPELEVFDSGMVNYGKYLIQKNILKPPFYFNLIFGMIANAQDDLNYIDSLIKDLPENSLWSLGGVGNSQLRINTLAIAYGGGVRVGLEDNIYWDSQRTQLATNYGLVKRIHRIAALLQREIMESHEFGAMGFYNEKV